MTRQDRITLLVAAMLTGQTTPGDKLIDQCIMFAELITKKIEDKHGRDTGSHQ